TDLVMPALRTRAFIRRYRLCLVIGLPLFASMKRASRAVALAQASPAGCKSRYPGKNASLWAHTALYSPSRAEHRAFAYPAAHRLFPGWRLPAAATHNRRTLTAWPDPSPPIHPLRKRHTAVGSPTG